MKCCIGSEECKNGVITVTVHCDKSLPICEECENFHSGEYEAESFYEERVQLFGLMGENINDIFEYALIYKQFKLKTGVFSKIITEYSSDDDSSLYGELLEYYYVIKNDIVTPTAADSYWKSDDWFGECFYSYVKYKSSTI